MPGHTCRTPGNCPSAHWRRLGSPQVRCGWVLAKREPLLPLGIKPRTIQCIVSRLLLVGNLFASAGLSSPPTCSFSCYFISCTLSCMACPFLLLVGVSFQPIAISIVLRVPLMVCMSVGKYDASLLKGFSPHAVPLISGT
jgi:hypothetical protein